MKANGEKMATEVTKESAQEAIQSFSNALNHWMQPKRSDIEEEEDLAAKLATVAEYLTQSDRDYYTFLRAVNYFHVGFSSVLEKDSTYIHQFPLLSLQHVDLTVRVESIGTQTDTPKLKVDFGIDARKVDSLNRILPQESEEKINEVTERLLELL